jgi:hypothetical protein
MVTPTGVTIRYFYEGLANTGLSNPQLTARVTSASAQPDQFDLSLVTWNDAAKFNLARLDANGASEIRNVAVEGDVLGAISAAAASFIGNGPLVAGVHLPLDDLAGVGVRDFVPDGSIEARSIQAVAFGSHIDEHGVTEPGAHADADDAARLLTPGTAIVPAHDTYRVPFADLAAQHVGFFLDTDPRGGRFDNDEIAFTVQANNGVPSNVARGAVTALITAVPSLDLHGEPADSIVQSIALRGDGASIDSEQWVSQSITSTGPVGDVNIDSGQGITDITVPAVFGSLTTPGPIAATVQTTGLRTDPITGAVSGVSADIGRAYLAPGPKGGPPVVTATVVQSGGLTGRLISRGNLISQVDTGAISGLIAAQGDIGAITTISGVTGRVGGIVANGPTSGEIFALGRILGDVALHGDLKGARIAARGDILGNVTIDGDLDSASALVSGGEIGDPAGLGTALKVGGLHGIIAAKGPITFAPHTPSTGPVFANATGLNAAAIDAIFTDCGLALGFDSAPGALDLAGLALILKDLGLLTVGTNGTLTGTTP